MKRPSDECPQCQIVTLQYHFPPKEARALGEMAESRSGTEHVQGELKHLVIPNTEEATRGYKVM